MRKNYEYPVKLDRDIFNQRSKEILDQLGIDYWIDLVEGVVWFADETDSLFFLGMVMDD